MFTFSSFINSSSLIKISCVWSSKEEPFAIPKKWLNSVLLFLPAPSAIFEGIEMAALFIWEINPNFSSWGISVHAKYIFFASWIYFCQKINFSNWCMVILCF